MGVNISNKEYKNYLVAVFLFTAFLEYTLVILNSISFLTLKNFIVAY